MTDIDLTEAVEAAARAMYADHCLPAEIHFRGFGSDHTITVVGAMEAGGAIGNGYLWAKTTPRAWRETGREVPDA